MRCDSNPIFPPRLPTALPRAVIAPLLAAALAAGAEPRSEPTDAVEAARKRSAEAALDERYQALVAGLPPDERAWEGVLQASLGSFYLPIHKRDRVAGRSTAWDFVKDDPALPRVLLIGDSISRGYTLPVRAALVREANVHRAPANCGPTASGLANLEAWLSSAPGGARWDVIHFNFGIHDRNTPLADYTARLERIVARLQETGATLVWASSTPIPDLPARQQSAASIVERNTAAAKIMERHGVAIDDLFAFIEPHLAATRLPDDVHFRAEGYELLGGRVAESIRAALK